MSTEQAMREYFDGSFTTIDYAKGQTVTSIVEKDYIPSHKPKYLAEDEEAPTNNNGHRWTVAEDEIVLEMRRAANTFRQIGKVIGLSPSSIQKRYADLCVMRGIKGTWGQNVRPIKFSLEMEARIVQLRGQGMGFDEIGPLLGLTRIQANHIYRRYRKRQEREGKAA